jgi:hypothetical protein
MDNLSSVLFILPNYGVMNIYFQTFVVYFDVDNYLEYYRNIMQQLSSIGLLS